MSERPLLATPVEADNIAMLGSRSRWRTISSLFLLLASLVFAACSGMSNSSNTPEATAETVEEAVAMGAVVGTVEARAAAI
jgi:uncharacterized lipoprotein YajG